MSRNKISQSQQKYNQAIRWLNEWATDNTGKLIYRLYFVHNDSQQDIADALEVTRAQVSARWSKEIVKNKYAPKEGE